MKPHQEQELLGVSEHLKYNSQGIVEKYEARLVARVGKFLTVDGFNRHVKNPFLT